MIPTRTQPTCPTPDPTAPHPTIPHPNARTDHQRSPPTPVPAPSSSPRHRASAVHSEPSPITPDYFNHVLVVRDKFSKMAHFIPTTTNVIAEETAKLLLENVVRLHGLPEVIISDRGHEFTAHLFQQLWTAFGTDLRLSTAYHPQSDGGTDSYESWNSSYERTPIVRVTTGSSG